MKLTDEQIAELAPDWATHYKEHGSDILFEGEDFFIYYDTILTRFRNKKSQLSWGINENSKPIPRKAFDIREYQFSDDKLSLLISDADLISLNDNCSNSCFDLFKEDIVAMAKHFNLTAEDLK